MTAAISITRVIVIITWITKNHSENEQKNMVTCIDLKKKYDNICDEVPTMVEMAIFWFQIRITNGLNFMHRKWYTGNKYMLNLQKIGCAIIWNGDRSIVLRSITPKVH